MPSKIITTLHKLVTDDSYRGPKLKILMVGAEVSPYASVGGYARVLAYLSKALLKQGHDVRVFMPKFGSIDDIKYQLTMVKEGLSVPTGAMPAGRQGDEGVQDLICNVKIGQMPGEAPVYFLENMEYYEKRANVYGYNDDPIRWALLSRGALEFLRGSGWTPDIIQVNDWHTGILPNYLKTVYKDDPKLSQIATVHTIHNLQFQGMYDHHTVSELDYDDGHSEIPSFFNPRLLRINFMRRGIMYADLVNTVSETYAHEILTPEFGEGLDKLLLEMRGKLSGVVNGIDYDEFNPANDKYIAQNYSVDSVGDRAVNKLALQKEFGLKQDLTVPVLGLVSRLDQQKGIGLIFDIIYPLMRDFDVQFVQVGGGDLSYVDALKKLQAEFPSNVRAHPMPNFTLPRLIFAGADIGLFPSRFEPCGLVQMEFQRYGAIPVARAVGGLADTVVNFDPATGKGTGFVFSDFDKWAFFGQIVRALETYRHQDIWRKLQKNAMAVDFSWNNAAKQYEKLFLKALDFKAKGPILARTNDEATLMLF